MKKCKDITVPDEPDKRPRVGRVAMTFGIAAAVIGAECLLLTQCRAGAAVNEVSPTMTPEPYVIYTAVPSTSPVAPSESDVRALARVLYNECRGLSEREQEAVAWCVCNRVDNASWPDTVEEVCRQDGQFAYSDDTPLEFQQLQIAERVLTAWLNGDDEDRALPEGYYYFVGDGVHNYFTREWHSSETLEVSE